jgi:hypothetical protein
MKYDKYRYIFPPRPKNAVSPDDLDFFDNGTFLCQCKLNGSNASIYTDGNKVIIMNRHGQRLTNTRVDNSEILSLYRGTGGWMVLNCEYMNKSKSDENNEVFNHKLAIFDILAYDGQYLVGSTFSERVELLDRIYGQVESEKYYLYSITKNAYRVKSYKSDFKYLYDNLTQIDMIEGIVMKRSDAKLEVGLTESNNTKSQIKVRRSTKNYKY